jgi:hypothetical protein
MSTDGFLGTMASPRPDFIDVRSASRVSVSRPLRSPRIHVVGEAPPELSPLDAFALQSRLLAKQLEESQRQGRRLSRLPPLTTDSPVIVQGRSEYFRSMSIDSDENDELPPLENLSLAFRTEIEENITNRPMSMHPRMSRIPATPDESIPLPTHPSIPLPTNTSFDAARRPPSSEAGEGANFFGVDARREQSPTPMDSASVKSKRSETGSLLNDNSYPREPKYAPVYSSPEKPMTKTSFDITGLIPPAPLFPKRSSSIMSSPLESTDGEGMSSLSASFYSHEHRKLSTSSSLASPGLHPYQRSPSISSEASGLPRPSFNFSRPLSRAGTPGLETPARQASSDSQASFILADDSAHTPVSMNSECFPDFNDDGKSAAPSYIYSKFTLPRGKILQRSSGMLLENQAQVQPQWEEPHTSSSSNSRAFPLNGQAPPSPPTRPTSAAGSRGGSRGLDEPGPTLERSKLSHEIVRNQPSPDPSLPSADGLRPSEDTPRGRALISPQHDALRERTALSTTTSDSASTIKPARSQYSNAPTIADMTAEEHVTKAIALHESGSLNESTYHLRHAAKQGHPTGMLLYALACRHGWGMRPNQREGVEWLRRAAESAHLEMAGGEDQASHGRPVDFAERKARKAQFALSIYELGVSHMKGWGIEQDKTLALRCYEIAGCKFTPRWTETKTAC